MGDGRRFPPAWQRTDRCGDGDHARHRQHDRGGDHDHDRDHDRDHEDEYVDDRLSRASASRHRDKPVRSHGST
jgi:hypothetical protein